MADQPRRCGTCRHLEIQPDAKGRRIARKGRAYWCLWPTPKHSWPVSVTRARGWSVPGAPNSRSYMEPTDGADCPEWSERDG
jgi:hypothetical protein